MIFQFSFFSYKSLETREYFSRRDKNLLDLLMIPRNDPLRKEKKNLRPDFKFFDCSNPPPPPPPPSCYEPCNLSIGGRFSLARRTKGSFTCEQRKRHLIRKAADEISSLYPVSSIWPFWGTPILRGLADRRRQPGDREVNEFPGRMIGRATVEKGTGEVGGRGREEKGKKGGGKGAEWPQEGQRRKLCRNRNTHTWRASTTCPGLTPSPTGVMRCSSTCIRRSVGRWPSPRVELKNLLTKQGKTRFAFHATEFRRDLLCWIYLLFFFSTFKIFIEYLYLFVCALFKKN